MPKQLQRLIKRDDSIIFVGDGDQENESGNRIRIGDIVRIILNSNTMNTMIDVLVAAIQKDSDIIGDVIQISREAEECSVDDRIIFHEDFVFTVSKAG